MTDSAQARSTGLRKSANTSHRPSQAAAAARPQQLSGQLVGVTSVPEASCRFSAVEMSPIPYPTWVISACSARWNDTITPSAAAAAARAAVTDSTGPGGGAFTRPGNSRQACAAPRATSTRRLRTSLYSQTADRPVSPGSRTAAATSPARTAWYGVWRRVAADAAAMAASRSSCVATARCPPLNRRSRSKIIIVQDHRDGGAPGELLPQFFITKGHMMILC